MFAELKIYLQKENNYKERREEGRFVEQNLKIKRGISEGMKLH